MKRAINSPTKYVQGKDEIKNLSEYVSVWGKSAFAVVDSFILEKYRDSITGSFGDAGITLYKFGGESSKAEVDRVISAMKEAGGDVVIGIGGGKTLDTAKAAGFYTACPTVIIPTAASSDAPCSALSVLYTEDGEFDEYLFLPKSPNLVLVDTAIAAAAPARLTVAGMGDALATYFEARACSASKAKSMAGGVCGVSAISLAGACYQSLLDNGYKAMLAAEEGLVNEALENIVETNTYMSGIGFESGGLAAAHAFHNGLTKLKETHGALHGEKVAFGTLVQLVLENAPDDEINEVLDFCEDIGLPTSLAMLGADNPKMEDLMEVAKASCAKGDTMSNMPFPVTPQDVLAAILVADKLGQQG